ncbi:Zinc knuckle CX2CX4HX4C [Sesbania bispinosa]|nr:Zinc knuckle CX2CX4HX4C [Sesbania bispinosa]
METHPSPNSQTSDPRKHEKPIHTNSLHNALAGIWCNLRGFKIEEIKDKTFQFFFYEERDAERVLKGNPWLFRNSWLVLKRWECDQSIEDMDFSKIPINVQLWGLPPHCKTTKMGMKIGSTIGSVQQTDLFETKDMGSFIKILVEVDVNKPLKSGINVGSNKDGVHWIDFQYERLPQTCYKCGLVGHDDEFCTQDSNAAGTEEEENRGLGPWIRAAQFGRKIVQTTKDYHEEANAKKQRPKTTQLSKDVLAKLSALSVAKEQSATPTIIGPSLNISHDSEKENLAPQQAPLTSPYKEVTNRIEAVAPCAEIPNAPTVETGNTQQQPNSAPHP